MASRLTPTLFDKLIAGSNQDGRNEAAGVDETTPRPNGVYTITQIEKFNEQAMRATVMRDLNWLMNSIHLGAAVDLAPYPQVQTSVLNYGVPDLTGRTSHVRLVQARGREIREAIRNFEPRLNPQRLDVEATVDPERPNALTFVIRSDIVSAVQAMPVQFKTEIEVETGAATVRE